MPTRNEEGHGCSSDDSDEPSTLPDYGHHVLDTASRLDRMAIQLSLSQILGILAKQQAQSEHQERLLRNQEAFTRRQLAEVRNAANRALNMQSRAATDVLHPIEVYIPERGVYAAPNDFPRNMHDFWRMPCSHLQKLHSTYDTKGWQSWPADENGHTKENPAAEHYYPMHESLEGAVTNARQAGLRELAGAIGVDYTAALYYRQERERLQELDSILSILSN